MNRSLRLSIVLVAFGFACVPWLCVKGQDKWDRRPRIPAKLLQADSGAIDCDACPRALAEAGNTAREELLTWNRFQLVEDRKAADLIFLFSANPYLGDYLTRDGPDKRPVMIDGVIMTVIDPHTGQSLWTDSRRWGSWRIAGATKDLIAELRGEMESLVKRWTLDEILHCDGTPAYQVFAFATPEEALKSNLGVERIEGDPNRLRVSSPDVPDFCRQAELVVGPENKIVRFEVVVSQAESLDTADVLQRADQFDFSGGKDPNSQVISFTARTKDTKILIQFNVQGRRPILSRVSYSY